MSEDGTDGFKDERSVVGGSKEVFGVFTADPLSAFPNPKITEEIPAVYGTTPPKPDVMMTELIKLYNEFGSIDTADDVLDALQEFIEKYAPERKEEL